MPDYVSRAELKATLDPVTLDWLERFAYLVGLDGQPCWEADRLEELLEHVPCQVGEPGA